MRIEQLEIFLSVADHGSVSRAAQQHFISQQGVSSMIKGLERELGTELFTRGPAGLSITDKGAILARYAAAVVADSRRLTTLAATDYAALDQQGEADEVEILAMPFVTSALDALFSDYEIAVPGAKLRIRERSLYNIVDDFSAGSVAARTSTKSGRLPLRIVSIMNHMSSTVGKMQGHFEPLVTSELMAAVPLNSPWSTREYLSREELCQIPIAYYSEPFLNRVVGKLFQGMSPDIVQNTSNINILNRTIRDRGAITFSDSFSGFLSRRSGNMALVPIRGTVFFVTGVLGDVEPGSPEDRFCRFLRRYLNTACAPYMERYGSLVTPIIGGDAR